MKGFERVIKGFTVWEGVGDQTELQHIDPHSYGHNSVSFPFSWAAQPGAWGPSLCWVLVFSTTSFLQLVWSPTGLTSCLHPGYIIVRRPPSSCGHQKSHSFNASTVKIISWYSLTRCTCYLHWCISYFDSLARSEVNIQHIKYKELSNLMGTVPLICFMGVYRTCKYSNNVVIINLTAILKSSPITLVELKLYHLLIELYIYCISKKIIWKLDLVLSVLYHLVY